MTVSAKASDLVRADGVTHADLDFSPDPSLDELTGLAAELCNAPMAVLALADGATWRFKSRAGIFVNEARRADFLLDEAPKDLSVIRDAMADPSTQAQPWVKGPPHVRFFAAVPLSVEDRYLGLLGILDTRVRDLSPLEGRTLLALAGAAMDRILLGPAQVRKLRHKLGEMMTEQAKTLEQLRHADRLGTVGKLTASIVHEVGTPLNVVSGYARLIQANEVEGEERTQSSQIIVDQVERIAGLLRQLLGFARRGKPEQVKQDLSILARQTLLLLRPIAETARVRLELEEPLPTLEVRADGSLLQQALTNLVSNAIQATPVGGGPVLVALSQANAAPPEQPKHRRAYAVFQVKDSGSGMSKETLSRVFEPFFTTKKAGEGTGLGLSVTRDIAREHGGFMTAQSELGRGSTFMLYLPLEGV